MCGYVGICNPKKEILKDIDIVKRMNNKLQRRGPNEEGYFIRDNIHLGHKRLTIIDAENGKQPMSVKYEDVVYTMVYNGQIYNKDELQKDLRERGYEFKGYSDTEVLLKAFIEYGVEVLSKLNGIFSFAVWNDKNKELVLVRDHFGIKPLYYTIIKDTIIFSSEVKSILEYPNLEVILDREGISEMFGLRTCTYTRNISI